MKKGVFIGLFLIVFFQSLQFLNADIISINSGGSQGLIINTDKYLEGFSLEIFKFFLYVEMEY